MENNYIAYYLKTLHGFTGIPITFICNRKLLHSYPDFQTDSSISNPADLLDRLQGNADWGCSLALCHVYIGAIYVGVVRDGAKERIIILGPIATESTDSKSITDFLFRAALEPEVENAFRQYLNETRRFSVNNLLSIIANVNLMLNGTIVSIHNIPTYFTEKSPDQINLAHFQYSAESTRFAQQDTGAFDDYERKLRYCLKTGDIDVLSDLVRNINFIPYEENQNMHHSLQQAKQTAVGAVFMAHAVASESGITPELMNPIKQYYLQKIDNCDTKQAVYRSSIDALFSFTAFVKNNISYTTNNPAIDRAIQYILNNLNTTIRISDIAKSLHMNEPYLYAKFKAETGKTPIQFINEQKIKKACYYLLFTDKPLVDIANHFSYSSQAYFQTVFKQVMGMTPTQYRKKHTYKK